MGIAGLFMLLALTKALRGDAIRLKERGPPLNPQYAGFLLDYCLQAVQHAANNYAACQADKIIRSVLSHVSTCLRRHV